MTSSKLNQADAKDESSSQVGAKRPVNEQDALEAASRATTDYSQFMPRLHSQKKWPRVIGWTVLAIIVMAGFGGGGYWLVKHHGKTGTPAGSPRSQTPISQSQTHTISATIAYASTNFNLSFKYPQNWTVSDTGNGKLTVTSPAMPITDANGQRRAGQMILDIEHQASADMGMFKAGNAVAVLDSQKINYSNPTSTQRANTYLSFLQYATTTVRGGLDGVYVTGDLGYLRLQAIPEGDIVKSDPLIRVTFVTCADKRCSSPSPMTITSSDWSDQNFASPIVNMVESLAVQ